MLVVFLCAVFITFGLIGRLIYLMIFDAAYYQELAEDLHEREREIKAARGEIVDRNGVVLATNETVCTISVIHSQIENEEEVIRILASELELDEDDSRLIYEGELFYDNTEYEFQIDAYSGAVLEWESDSVRRP